MHVRQAIVPSLEAMRESLVVDAKLVEDRRVQIMDMDRLLGNIVADIVRCSVDDPWLDSSARHPDGETAWVMIASEFLTPRSLGIRGAAELATPDDKRVVQHAALLEIA